MQKRRKTAPPTKETKKGGNEEPKQRDQKKLEETRQRRNEATRKRRNEETKKRGNEETKKQRNEETKKRGNQEMRQRRKEETKKWTKWETKTSRNKGKWRTKKRGKEETKKHRRNEETHLCPTLLLAWGMSFWLNARHVSLMDFLWSRSTVVLWNHSLYACVLVQICSIALTCLSLTQILLLCVLLFVPISIVKVGLCTIIFCFHSVLSWSNLCPNTFAAIYVRVTSREASLMGFLVGGPTSASPVKFGAFGTFDAKFSERFGSCAGGKLYLHALPVGDRSRLHWNF